MCWKIIFDFVGAVVGTILLSPILTIITLVILTLDGRPILFHQQRLGLNKQSFTIYKFRTMYNGKVSRSGKLLRQTGLDELAQILNILLGDMSIVGPRPLTLVDVRRLGWDDAYHAQRWTLKPGITGLAQLYGGRGAKRSWYMDQLYIKKQSIGLDFWIIGLSLLVNLFGKQRVRRWLTT